MMVQLTKGQKLSQICSSQIPDLNYSARKIKGFQLLETGVCVKPIPI